MYLYTYLSVYLSINLSIYLSYYLSYYPSYYPTIYLSIYLSIQDDVREPIEKELPQRMSNLIENFKLLCKKDKLTDQDFIKIGQGMFVHFIVCFRNWFGLMNSIKGAYWISSNCKFFQYCDSKTGLFSIASCKFIALTTIATSIVVALTRS